MTALLLSALLALIPHGTEGDAQAFTAVTDAQGRALADARYAQWIDGDTLHIETRSDFPSGRVIVERATLLLHPRLEQQGWEWSERNGEKLLREYSVDFRAGKAVATRYDQHKRWKEDVEVKPGTTFAGIGFVTAIKALRSQLAPGQHIELQAVAMTPKPRTATVTVTRDGATKVRMAGRTLDADQYTIHPEIPAIAKLFIHAPDQHVWLFGSDPAAFLRYEGPMVEPGDPIIRIDLIPGTSAHAEARAPHPRRRSLEQARQR